MANLPEAPKREQFESQEEFEEALGYWQGHVGRIKGLVARYAKKTAISPDSSGSEPQPANSPPSTGESSK